MRTVQRLAGIGLALAMMAYGASPLFRVHATEEARTCCTDSSGCPGNDICCYPSGGETQCSGGNANYCKNAC